MSRPMKWHIWNNAKKKHPLCWDDTVLEFDSEEAAKRFLESAIQANKRGDMSYDNVIIAEDILFWDGGYLNATCLKIVWDEDKSKVTLVEVAAAGIAPVKVSLSAATKLPPAELKA